MAPFKACTAALLWSEVRWEVRCPAFSEGLLEALYLVPFVVIPKEFGAF